MSKIGKCRFMVARGRERENWGKTANGDKVSFWGDQIVLKMIVVMAAQFCKHTKNCFIGHFK